MLEHIVPARHSILRKGIARWFYRDGVEGDYPIEHVGPRRHGGVARHGLGVQSHREYEILALLGDLTPVDVLVVLPYFVDPIVLAVVYNAGLPSGNVSQDWSCCRTGWSCLCVPLGAADHQGGSKQQAVGFPNRVHRFLQSVEMVIARCAASISFGPSPSSYSRHGHPRAHLPTAGTRRQRRRSTDCW